MNQKHDRPEGGATIPAWFPGNVIEAIGETVNLIGETRSFVIAEATRLGLGKVGQKYANGNGHGQVDKKVKRRSPTPKKSAQKKTSERKF